MFNLKFTFKSSRFIEIKFFRRISHNRLYIFIFRYVNFIKRGVNHKIFSFELNLLRFNLIHDPFISIGFKLNLLVYFYLLKN